MAHVHCVISQNHYSFWVVWKSDDFQELKLYLRYFEWGTPIPQKLCCCGHTQLAEGQKLLWSAPEEVNS